MTFDDATMTSDGDGDYSVLEKTACMTFHTVSVYKSNVNEKLGLTLVYGPMDYDGTCDIVVGEIDPSGTVAGVCNIQKGDQIVEINGIPVRSRDEVLRLLGKAAAGASRITLTLARRDVIPQMIDDDDDDDIDAGFDDRYNAAMSPAAHHYPSALQTATMYNLATGRMLECIDEEDDLTDPGGECSSRHHCEEVDSGLSKTDESIRNDESSEQDTDSPSAYTPPSRSRADNEMTSRRPSALSFNSDDGNFVLLPTSQSIRQTTNTPYHQHCPPMTSSSCANSCSDIDSSSGKPPLPPRSRLMPRTTKYQDQANEVSLINGVNRMFVTNDVRNASPTRSQPTLRRVPRMGTRLNLNLNLNLNAPSVNQRNSNVVSSDTGYQRRIDRCNDPLCWSPGHDYCVIADEMGNCFNFPAVSPPQAAVVDKVCMQPLQLDDFSRVSSPPPLPFVLLSPRSSCASPTDAGVVHDSDAARRSARSRPSPTGVATRGTQTMAAAEAYEKCADVMYTNHANLQHTIAVQQRLFRQQLADRHRRHPSPTVQCDGTADNVASASASSGCSSRGAERLEWVVRRRSDGSRYVARRPVNASAPRMPSVDSCNRRPSSAAKTSSILLSSGRSAAEAWTTTDDDDDEYDSPKAGRYWTREQRRQQVADRRRRAALKQQAREDAAAAAAASVISPTDNRLRRGLSRARRDLATELAIVDGLKIGQHQRSTAETGGKRLFNANCNLLSVATV